MIGCEKECGRRQHGIGAIPPQHGIATLHIAPELLGSLLQSGLDADQRVARKVIGEERGRIEEQGQVILDTRDCHALANVPVHGAARGIALEGLAELAAKACLPFLIEREFPRGKQSHLVHLVDRALRVDIETADALNEVVVELDAIRQGAARGKQVKQAAAHAILARRHDLGDMRIARGYELLTQRLRLQSLPLPEEERACREVLYGREAVEGGSDRNDCDVDLALHELVERGQPLRHQILMGRELIVGQRFPVGQQMDPERFVEERHFLAQALGIGRGRRDDHEWAPHPGEPRQR